MRFVPIFILCLLAGCGTVPVPQPEDVPAFSRHAHDLYPSHERQYLSCDYRSWSVADGGDSFGADRQYYQPWASSMHAQHPDTLKAIKSSFVYALMSSNVYRDPKDAHYRIPGWTPAYRYTSQTGLVFEEWHKKEGGTIREIAVIFQGTDDWKDMAASLSPWFEPKQYAQAQRYVQALLQNPEYGNIPITVAGHSLGGGIALNVSLRHSTKARPIHAFAFNMSPRAFFGPYDGLPATRILINERAEGLAALRRLWWRKVGTYEPYPVNFLDFSMTVKPLSEHSIYRLSRGLLLVAIGTGDTYAREVFRANFNMEQVPQPETNNEDERRRHDYTMCKSLLETSVAAAP